MIEERPALDNFQNAFDRVKMSIYSQCARLGIPCPITGHASKTADH
jgi:hypothetical protein